MSGVQLLDKTRKIGKLLHNNNSSKVVFNDICKVMQEVKTDKCLPIRGDVFKYIQSCREQFDFIFADPPYELPNLETIPDQIFANNVLKEGGLFVLGRKRVFRST